MTDSFSRARVAAATLATIVLAGVVPGHAFAPQHPLQGIAEIAPVAVALVVRPLAQAIIAAPNDDARRALLLANPALKTAVLDNTIYYLLETMKGLTTPDAKIQHRFLRGLATEIHDADSAAIALIALGIDDAKLGDYDAALEQFVQARQEALDAHLPRRAAQALVNTGILHRRRGDYDLAHDCYIEGLRVLEGQDDPRELAAILTNLAVLDSDTGNYREALEIDARSMALLEQSDPRSKEMAILLTNIGVVYDLQRDDERAIDYYQRAAALSEDVNPEAATAAYDNLGAAATVAGRYADADTFLHKSMALARRDSNHLQEGTITFNLAALEQARHHDDAALTMFEESRRLRAQYDPSRVMASDEKLSEVLLGMGRFDDARAAAQRAVEMARSHGALGALWALQNQLGRIEMARDDRPAAEAAMRGAIASVEELRTRVGGGAEQQQRFFADMLDPYEELMGMLAQDHADADAFAMAERMRARSLVELIRDNALNVTQTMTPDEHDRERAVRHDVVLLAQQLNSFRSAAKPDPARITTWDSRLQSARNAEDDFYTHLYGAHPGLKEQRGDVPLASIGDLRDVITDDSTAAIEFQITEQRVFVFVVRKGLGTGPPKLTVHVVEITAADLANRVGDFRMKLASRDLGIKQPARALYDLLWQPAAADLAGATNIIVAPSGPLWDLPFQALVTPTGHYLIEQTTISLVPSFSALRAMQSGDATRHSTTSGAVALVYGSRGATETGVKGSPSNAMGAADAGLRPLLEAEVQARAIGQIYGPSRARVVVGSDASAQRFAAEAGAYRIVHVAAHGVLDDVSPLHSYVLLGRSATDAPDAGRVEAASLMQMALHADLVVLSACDTGRGKIGDGEGLIGMSWALFAAGVPSTVVSQWQVDSGSTTELMTEFHRLINAELIKSGRVEGRSKSLQQAALKLLHSSAYAHPFYWAPFVVMGNGS